MAKEVQDVMAGIVRTQRKIAPPEGQKKATVPDEPPASIGAFPFWLNLLERLPIEARGMGFTSRHVRQRWGLHLLFSPAKDAKYAYRERFHWVKPVLDAFDADPKLDGSCVQAEIVDVTLEPPLDWNETEYIALTFIMEVLTNGEA